MGRNVRSLVMAGCLGLATVMVSGCASDKSRSTGQYIDDRMTAHKVKADLKNNPIYKFEDINVTAYRGVVQLSGWVEKPEQKQVAEQIAKNSAGVVDVINNITFKPQVQILMPTGQSEGGRPLYEKEPRQLQSEHHRTQEQILREQQQREQQQREQQNQSQP